MRRVLAVRQRQREARLLPAAAGVLLALTPWLWRKTLALPERARHPADVRGVECDGPLAALPSLFPSRGRLSGAAFGDAPAAWE